MQILVTLGLDGYVGWFLLIDDLRLTGQKLDGPIYAVCSL